MIIKTEYFNNDIKSKKEICIYRKLITNEEVDNIRRYLQKNGYREISISLNCEVWGPVIISKKGIIGFFNKLIGGKEIEK